MLYFYLFICLNCLIINLIQYLKYEAVWVLNIYLLSRWWLVDWEIETRSQSFHFYFLWHWLDLHMSIPGSRWSFQYPCGSPIFAFVPLNNQISEVYLYPVGLFYQKHILSAWLIREMSVYAHLAAKIKVYGGITSPSLLRN